MILDFFKMFGIVALVMIFILFIFFICTIFLERFFKVTQSSLHTVHHDIVQDARQMPYDIVYDIV